MRVQDGWSFGFPPEGNVSRSRGSDKPADIFGVDAWMPSGNVRYALSPSDYGGENADVFGLGYGLPGPGYGKTGGSSDVFGLGDGSCSCPVLNEKNISMVVAGGLLGYFGVDTGSKTWNTVIRTVGGAVAFLGILDVLKGYQQKSGASAKEAPGTSGLGSEWYPDKKEYYYSNRLAHELDQRFADNGIEVPKYGCTSCEGLGQCTSCLMGLGQVEYWIHDPEDMQMPLLKMQCPPFMVAPGYVIAKHGPKGRVDTMPVEPPTMWGLGSLGFWEVLSPDGTRIAASRCRPFESDNTLTIKQVAGGKEFLRQSGAAPYPEGTVRSRRGSLMTTRRG